MIVGFGMEVLLSDLRDMSVVDGCDGFVEGNFCFDVVL